MNLQSSYDGLRWCDRFKSTQVYHHVEAFAKKIRKRKRYDEGVINAGAEQREIDAFYKVEWEYEHAHSSMSCDITDPLYVQPRAEQAKQLSEALEAYYQQCQSFITRLKAEHEDETAFRVETTAVEPLINISQNDWRTGKYTEAQEKSYQNLLCAKEAYRNFIETFDQAIKSMLKHVERFKDEVDAENYPYINICHILETLKEWVEWLRPNPSQEEEPPNEVLSIYSFMSSFIAAAEEMKQGKRSALFNFSPSIEIMTYLIHPVLLGIYANHQKERILWKNQYQHDVLNINFDQKIEEGSLLQDTPHFEITRTVFINLDGHESEFNIEFAKNMENHLMYISFPKIDKDTRPENMPFHNRLFKKIFFNHARELYEYEGAGYDVLESYEHSRQQEQGMEEEEEIKQIRKQLEAKYDPERYFEAVEKIYRAAKTAESNQNIFVFPVSWRYLQEEMGTFFEDKEADGSQHASYFIDFMLREVLMEDIRRFNPQMVVLSYNGTTVLKDQHWIRCLQQLSSVSCRRMMLFPNFTTHAVNADILADSECRYDNFIGSDYRIEDCCTIDLMMKFSQFLKIASGTYNLELPKEKESILPRYKQTKLYNYTKGLLNCYSHEEYPHLRNRISDLILRCENIIVNRSVEENIEDIRKAVPGFYQQLFGHIRQILLGETDKYPNYMTDWIAELTKQLWSGSALSTKDNKEPTISEIIQRFELEIASEKYSELAYVYYKIKESKVEYEELKEYMKLNTQAEQPFNVNKREVDNIGGIYALSLRYINSNKEKANLPVSHKTELVFHTDQRMRILSGKKGANLMLMNHLENNEFVSFAGLVTLNSPETQQNKVTVQRVEMHPIVFQGMPALNLNNFVVRTGWNYAETNKYYYLYWPLQFNLLEAKLREINNEKYEPSVLNQIYIAEIPEGKQHRLVFHRVMAGEGQTVPRRFCSALELFEQDKLFIMGGFYDKEFNYLNLQNNITGLDASNYSPENPKCQLSNEKGNLYSELMRPAPDRTKTNSYVRARREYEFYPLEELCALTPDEVEEEARCRSFVMVGGFGQNFVRPYSLMSCNYYIVKVDLETKTISSIERKMVYEKLLTTNINGFIKNNGYFEKMPILDKNILRPDENISPDEYIGHRSVYRITRDEFNNEELLTKTKYFFAIDLYPNLKKQYMKLATKIGEYIDTKTNQTSEFFLSLSQQSNHYLVIRQNRQKEWMTPIFFEKPESKGKVQKVALTHGSVISIDIRFKHIYALIMHQSYTNGRYVLAQCEMPSEQAEVLLKTVCQFKEDLEQHYLFTPRPNQVLLLHGITFKNVQIRDFLYRVPRKQGSKEDPIRGINSAPKINPALFRRCHTVMVKGQNKETKALEIDAASLLLPLQSKPSSYTLTKQRLRLNEKSAEFVWEESGDYHVVFVDEHSKNPLYIVKVEEIRQNQLWSESSSATPTVYSSPTITALMSRQNSGSLIVKVTCYNRQSYIGMLSSNTMFTGSSGETVRVSMINSEDKQARRSWDLLAPVHSLNKSLNRYEDMEVKMISRQ